MAATAPAQFISTDSYFSNLPQGFQRSTTPQGGTSYTDQSGNMYIPQPGGGLKLATNLPAQQAVIPNSASSVSASGTSTVSAANPGTTPVTPGSTPSTGANPPVASPAPAGTGTLPGTTPPVAPKTPATPVPPTSGTSGTNNGTAPNTGANGATPVVNPDGSVAKTAAQIQSETDAAGAANVAPTTGTRTSATIEKTLEDTLDKLGAPPTPPDVNTEQTDAENLEGIPGIQSNITTLQGQLQQAQTTAMENVGAEASKPGVVASIINGRMKMISVQDAAAIKTIQDQLTQANTDLKNAQTAVATIMKNNNTNYTESMTQWNDQYKAAVQLYTSENTEFSKEQVSALANEKVIVNSFSGNPTLPTGGITDDEITSWDNIDLQSGLPIGTTLTAIVNKLNLTKFQKGSDGNMYAVGMKDGVPYVALVGSAGGTTAAANQANGTTRTPTKDDVSKVSTQIQSKVGTDGYISPSDWQTAMNAWEAAGYTEATFVSSFKNYANPKDVYAGLGGNQKGTTSTSGSTTINFSPIGG